MKIIAKIIKREQVKSTLLELEENIKSNESYKNFFIREMQQRNISNDDFKQHFKNNRWICSITDDYSFGCLMTTPKSNKEWCDLNWLKHIMERVNYHTRQKDEQETRTSDVINRFLNK